MLALLSQIPAAQAEDTDRPHQATFVPYRSPHIREVDPSLYLTNPAALGGAQLFYAIPSDDDGYTHPSSLLGDSLMMIYPYNGKKSVEWGLHKHVYCWGKLDNLIMTPETYWARPSTSFLSIFWPKSATDGKFTLDFTRYKDELALHREYEDMKEKSSYKRLLGIQSSSKCPSDFKSCPWTDMLERRKKGTPALGGASLDAGDTGKLRDKLNSLRLKQWPCTWAAALSIEPSKDRKSRLQAPYYWTGDSYRELNGNINQYDGLFLLKDYTCHEWDFPKKQDADRQGYHFLPVSGAIGIYSETDSTMNPDNEAPALAKAVIMTPSEEAYAAYVLAVMADWNRSSSIEDGISINKDFQAVGGHCNPVAVPEYHCAAIEPPRNADEGYLEIAFPDGRACVSWIGPNKLIWQESGEQSPIAYAANQKKIRLQLVVALPALGGGPDSPQGFPWDVEVEDYREAIGDMFADGYSPVADWDRCQPKVLNLPFRHVDSDAKKIPAFPIGITTRSSQEVSDRVSICDLYQITLEADSNSIPPSFRRIQSGEMAYKLHFKHRDTGIACSASFHLHKVYTIFGDSTLRADGLVKLPDSCSNVVLPWEDALNTVTRQFLCDRNPIQAQWTAATEMECKNALQALTMGIANTTRYPNSAELANFTPVKPENIIFDSPQNDEIGARCFPETGQTINLFLSRAAEACPSLFSLDLHPLDLRSMFKEKGSPALRDIENINDAYIDNTILDYYQPLDYSNISEEGQILRSRICFYPDYQFTFFDVDRVCSCRDRKFICVDAANTLSVLTKIMGFPSTVQRVNIIAWHLNESTKKYYPSPHCYNVYNNLSYDATTSELNKKSWDMLNLEDSFILANSYPKYYANGNYSLENYATYYNEVQNIKKRMIFDKFIRTVKYRKTNNSN